MSAENWRFDQRLEDGKKKEIVLDRIGASPETGSEGPMEGGS